jgi:hypothetical protein
MGNRYSVSRIAFLALPAVVLFGYACFIVTTYWPYLDRNLRLRSPDLAGLLEDVIGFGFWMWWPLVTVLFAASLAVGLSAMHRRLYAAVLLVGVFVLLSVCDYLLCHRLVQELISAPAGAAGSATDSAGAYLGFCPAVSCVSLRLPLHTRQYFG